MEGSTSKDYFECVMVNVPIDIEGGVQIKNVRIINLPVYWRVRGESWQQVCTANNGVDVNDAHVVHASAGRLGLDYP